MNKSPMDSPMDLFAGVVPFVATSEARSFRAAAKQLGVTAPAVSKAISKLEADLGVRLLHRTSRSVTLTAEGELFLRKCRAAVDEVREARVALYESQQAPSGVLRISLPHRLGAKVMARLPRLVAEHPRLTVHAMLTDRFVQLTHENVDVALRLGGLTDSTCTARRLRSLRMVTVASRAYLKRRGAPRVPQDLARHNCLRFLLQTGIPQEWSFRQDGGVHAVPVDGNVIADHGESLVAAAIAGAGLMQAPDIMIADELARGELVPVLSAHAAPGPPLTAVCVPGRNRSPKVRAYVDLLVDIFAVKRP
jgi:DNA-binding transcriptional LysR family regulator